MQGGVNEGGDLQANATMELREEACVASVKFFGEISHILYFMPIGGLKDMYMV